MSGARAAVIPYDSSREQLDALFAGVNGILFTGGGLSLQFNTQYYQTAHYLFEKVKAANDKGDHMVLWG